MLRRGLSKVFNLKTVGYTSFGSLTALGVWGEIRRQEKNAMTNTFHTTWEDLGWELPPEYDTTKLHEIQPHKMKDGEWRTLDDDHVYSLGFALKPGFEAQLGKNALAHGSLAIEIEDKEFLVVGRQSPILQTQKIPTDEKPKDLSEKIKTVFDNEKKYTMPGVLSNFKLLDPHALVTGAEIKAAFAKAEEKICQQQLCDMAKSNCCTAAVEAICNLIKEVNKRENSPAKAETLLNLNVLLYYASHANFSQGISNNKVVSESIKTTLELVKKSNVKSEAKPEITTPTMGSK